LPTLLLDKHPDKTFIGRIERGFDFLGYHFSREGLTVARQTIARFVARVTRLYEQERERPDGPSALGDYVRRWGQGVRAGVPEGALAWPSGHVGGVRGDTGLRVCKWPHTPELMGLTPRPGG